MKLPDILSLVSNYSNTITDYAEENWIYAILVILLIFIVIIWMVIT